MPSSYPYFLKIVVSPYHTGTDTHTQKCIRASYFLCWYYWKDLELEEILNYSTITRQGLHWQAPNCEVFNIHCDAAVSDNFICTATVVRDWKRNLIAASPSIAGNSTVIAVEALGLRGAVFPSQVLKLRKVRIERDSKICIDAINSALKEEKPISTPWETIMVCLDGVDLGSWIWIWGPKSKFFVLMT